MHKAEVQGAVPILANDELPVGADPAWGRFLDPIETRWVRGGKNRDMVVVAPARFQRPNGQTIWIDPPFRFDGASIPRALWTWPLGSPFTGAYRDAAVFHDYLCRLREDSGLSSRDAHRVLYEGARALGYPRVLAAALERGVIIGGPRW